MVNRDLSRLLSPARPFSGAQRRDDRRGVARSLRTHRYCLGGGGSGVFFPAAGGCGGGAAEGGGGGVRGIGRLPGADRSRRARPSQWRRANGSYVPHRPNILRANRRPARAHRRRDTSAPVTASLANTIPSPYVSVADGCESGFAAFGQPARPPQQWVWNPWRATQRPPHLTLRCPGGSADAL